MNSLFLETIAKIQRAKITLEFDETPKTEDVFIANAVELLMEARGYIYSAAKALPKGSTTWSRNEAIVGGHFVRLFKLLDALLDQACQSKRELVVILSRLAFETIANTMYLIHFGDDEVFDSYMKYSLRHEKKLHNRVRSKITQRSGIAMPIEHRMLNSIEKAVKNAGYNIEELETKSPHSWGENTIFDRCEKVGLKDIYLAAFGGMSANIHGNWMDLSEYQLNRHDDRFSPSLEFTPPRPQQLEVIALFSTHLLEAYCRFIDEQAYEDSVSSDLLNLRKRIEEASTTHEAYLVDQMHD